MEFAYPLVLVAIFAVAPLAWLAARRKPAALPVPTLAGLRAVPPTARMRLLWLPAVLRALAAVVLIVAVARPRTVDAETVVPAQGIDIVLALDVSGSMDQRIGGSTRLDAAVEVMKGFIDERTDDRIGLVAFSEFATTLSPPTLDHAALQQLVQDVADAELKNATAIGLAISESTSVLQQSSAPSRIVILLTDGVDNVESATRPLTAARIAEALGVRVYTVGIVDPLDPSGVDRETLAGIAEITGARTFEANSVDDLTDVYDEINKLETTGVERDRFTSYREFGPWFALLAAAFIAGDVVLRSTWLRRASA